MKHLRTILLIIGTCACYALMLFFIEIPWKTIPRTSEQRISIHLLPTAPVFAIGTDQNETTEDTTAHQEVERTNEMDHSSEQQDIVSNETKADKLDTLQKTEQDLPQVDKLFSQVLEASRSRKVPTVETKEVETVAEAAQAKESVLQETPQVKRFVNEIPQVTFQPSLEEPKSSDTWKEPTQALQEPQKKHEMTIEWKPVTKEGENPATLMKEMPGQQEAIQPAVHSTTATTIAQQQTATAKYIDVDSTSIAPQFPLDTIRKQMTYPTTARRQGKEGTVILELWISAYGQIDKVEIVEDPGYGMGQAALAAFSNVICIPGFVGNKPVAVRMKYPIRFTLQQATNV